MHKRLREIPTSGGSSVFAKSIFDKEVFKYGKLILDELNWHGVAMVEFKKEISTNKLYLMEINPKFWGSHDLSIDSGLNFAKEYISISPNINSSNLNIDRLISYKLNNKFQWPARDIISNLLKPKRLFCSLVNFLDPNVNNNFYSNDPIPTLYLITSAIFSPILKKCLFKNVFKVFYRVKTFGTFVALIRTLTEISGIPLLRYSRVTNNIALGMQPKLFFKKK